MQQLHLNDWVTTVLKCLEQNEKRAERRQKVDATTFPRHVSWAVDQHIGQVLKFLQIWKPEYLELMSEITESDSK